MSRTGLWPREKPRPTDSRAEQKVYSALSAQLPDGWTAWHSLRIRTDEGCEGEGDFVIAIPGRGLLVLEVKGGKVEQRDGRWFQNGDEMEQAPRAQAHGYAKLLISRLKQLGCLSVPYGIFTVFPDTSYDSPATQDDLHELVLGEQDLPWLAEAIAARLDRAFPADYLIPPCNWMGLLHQLWGETWIPRVRLGHRAAVNAEERYQLDLKQMEVLELFGGNDKLVVSGVAGSGKTLLAREAALRQSTEGKRVRLLCFTDALAKWLEMSMQGRGVEVDTVPRYAARLLQRGGVLTGLPVEPGEWADVSLRAAAEVLPEGDERPEVLIVDEAQDLADNDWLLVEELARDARTWIFYDPAQSFWSDRRLPGWVESLPNCRLNKSYRCPEPILEFSKQLSGAVYDAAVVEKGFADQVIGVVECPSPSSVPAKVENEIRKLRGQGFEPGDIAVLSLRGKTAGGFATMDKIGSFPVVRADSENIERNVVADTFLRFKGLERPAVIVTDLGKVTDRFDTRVHIALTRALDAVRVVNHQTS